MTQSKLPRRILLGLPLALAACGLSERPYAEQRQWPLVARRSSTLPPPARGLVLELRSLRAGAGLETRGLQTILPDGSIQTAFYEQWAVPPAQGVEDSLRTWLTQSGLFTAVVGQGSRGAPDLSLEGEVTALWATSVAGTATVAITLIDLRSPARQIRLQRSFTAAAPLRDADPAAAVQAQMAALADVLTQIEAAIATSR